MAARFLMTGIKKVTAYRAELEGLYRSLIDIGFLKKSRHRIEQWCDNKTAVKNSNMSPKTPTAMIASEADVALAIQFLRAQYEAGATTKHIYGHQDTRGQGHEGTQETEQGERERHPYPRLWAGKQGIGMPSTQERRYLQDTFGIGLSRSDETPSQMGSNTEKEREDRRARGIRFRNKRKEDKTDYETE